MTTFKFVNLDGQNGEVYVIDKDAKMAFARVAIDIHVPEENVWYGHDLDIAGADALIAALTAARDEVRRLNEEGGE